MDKFFILLFLMASVMLNGQEYVVNGSFEGLVPILNKVPLRWHSCDEESTPDIQPSTSKKPAVFGKAYLGLVGRVFVENKPILNGTVESIFQQLDDSLTPGHEYRLTVQLAHDPDHKPLLTDEIVGPGIVKFYVGIDFCENYRHVWTSDLISHEDWRQYEVAFQAECGDRFIGIEVGFGDSINYNYNYVMVDSVSLQPSSIGNNDTIDCTIIPDSIPEDTVDISYMPCKIFVPTAFSPNNDGINDIFKIYGDCNIKRFTMHIFNRWGNKVFQTQDQDQGWSGYFRGALAAPDIYLYQVLFEYIDEQGSTRHSNLSNTLTLLR